MKPDTADRVRSAIRRLNYRPNPFAKGLTTRRSRLLGLSVPELHGEYYSSLVTAADRAARARGYHVLVTSHIPGGGEGGEVGGPSEDPRDAFRIDVLDGLLLMVTDLERDARNLAALEELAVPAVVLGRAGPGGRAPSLVVDSAAGARAATRHLLDGTPPERCFFVGGPRTNSDTAERQGAFLATLREAGHRASADQCAFGSYSIDTGVRWARGMIAAGRLAGAAVLAGNDEIAVGILNEARDSGIEVPRDLRIVGFDDTSLCRLVRPTLSSVRIPKEDLGRGAVDLLIDLIESGGAAPAARPLATELVVRESSAVPGPAA